MAVLTINIAHGPHWTSNADQANWDLVVARVISDLAGNLSPALTTAFTISIDYGFNNGVAVPAGVAGNTSNAITDTSFTYTQTRSALQALTLNSLQTIAYNNTNFPSTSPFGGGSVIRLSNLLESAVGLAQFNSGAFTAAFVGLSAVVTFDTTVDGSTSANGLSLYGVLMHEFTEILGRVCDVGDGSDYTTCDMFTFDNSNTGTRNVSRTGTFRGAFGDGGFTNIIGYFNQSMSLDAGDFDASLNTFGLNSCFCSPSAAGFAPSRSPTQPLLATDWQLMTVIGWPLTSTGLTNASLTLPAGATYGFSAGLKR